ncbi:MAG: GNAT family N-acetyltransferase [Curvibacter lanceolatus]|jgi:GNAT superfamily N-acetyltransferase|uniref:GNAT family N-acetyltransferase n=1 Tax=Curvibacter lanceolatus TaxID=86182 RepID=UPI00036A061B|nr:GNAT family N-acetyltransferase [Curvibacter lanceolatus]MBV5290789.1 GNAT family N-acetyltransferase [Curvibacter lanceolatus]
MSAEQPTLRGLQAADLPALMALQALAYGAAFVEPAAVMAQRLAITPLTVWGLFDAPGALCAYLLAYRSVPGAVAPLHHPFDPAPQSTALYLHDLAVHPSAKGLGLGPRLVAAALALARAEGLGGLGLVAVQGSQPFWRRQGFQDRRPDAASQATLAGYGEGAVYLWRSLP